MREQAGGKLRRREKEEKKDLAVEMRPGDGAANPAVEAEVDKRGEGPDVFFAGDAAVGSEDGGDAEVYGKGEELVMAEGGEREGGATDHGGPGAEEQAEDGGGLEGDVRGEEVGDTHADQNAEHQGDADPGEEAEGLAGVAVLEQEQTLEAGGARQRTGDRRGHAQLDQEGDKDQFGVARVHGSTLHSKLLKI